MRFEKDYDSLTLQEKLKEYARCAKSPAYFLNTYGYVFDSNKKKVSEMTCFEYQVDCLNAFNKYRNNIVLKSRQTGLSVISAGYVAWRLLFRYDERILIIANDANGAQRFLATVKQFLEYAPDFLKPNGEPITNNTKKVHLANGSWAEAKASSPQAGRGESITLLVLDEAAFIDDIEDIWMGAGMALSKTGGKCLMISTPKGAGSLYYRTWKDAVNGDNDFNPITVHWRQNPDCKKGLEKRTSLDGDEYWWSPWYEEQCIRLNWDSVKIAQELDLSFESSKALVIDSKLVYRYQEKTREIKATKFLDFDFLYKDDLNQFLKMTNKETYCHVFKEREIGANYVVGCDVSKGDSADYSTVQVINAVTLEQVCEYRAKISIDLFPYIINAISRYYNEAFCAIEANNFGLGVAYDLKNKFKYERLYYSKNVLDIYVRPGDYKVSQGDSIPGFQTTRKTRPLLVQSLISHLREGLIINSRRLVSEFETFVMVGDKPQHEPGYNDDLIFAIAIALFVRDTEYNNVIATKSMYKSMIDAISVNSNAMNGIIKKDPEFTKKIDLSKAGGSGIFFSNNGNVDNNSSNLEDDNDLSWLYK